MSSERKPVRVVPGEKASRTPAQRKISSELLTVLRDRQCSRKAATGTDGESEPDASVVVDIKATVTDGLLGQIEALGGTVVNSFPQYKAIRAEIPVAQVEALAESPDVKSIRSADQLQLH